MPVKRLKCKSCSNFLVPWGKTKLGKTTNELKASFGHLAKRWLSHRGLKKERWETFMKWFVYFYNQEKMAVSKQKKV